MLVESFGVLVSMVSSILPTNDDLAKIVVASVGASVTTFGLYNGWEAIGQGGPVTEGFAIGEFLSSWVMPVVDATAPGF
jgi:hypothetical protein